MKDRETFLPDFFEYSSVALPANDADHRRLKEKERWRRKERDTHTDIHSLTHMRWFFSRVLNSQSNGEGRKERVKRLILFWTVVVKLLYLFFLLNYIIEIVFEKSLISTLNLYLEIEAATWEKNENRRRINNTSLKCESEGYFLPSFWSPFLYRQEVREIRLCSVSVIILILFAIWCNWERGKSAARRRKGEVYLRRCSEFGMNAYF